MDIEKLKGVAIHCKTEKEAIACCNLADKLGLKWMSAHRFSEINNWKDFREKTAYVFYEGTYSDFNDCKICGCKIHYAQWFLKNFGNNN